jgi:hypothetical protein
MKGSSKNFVRVCKVFYKQGESLNSTWEEKGMSTLRLPDTIQTLNTAELDKLVEVQQKRIKDGKASDNDYLEFIMGKLELAERQDLRG